MKTLMRWMGIEALYRRPPTTKPEPGDKIYPYLLRGVAITRPNQVWAMDITYIPMARGFIYLAAVVDWFSRRVLAWKLSITMDVCGSRPEFGSSQNKYLGFSAMARAMATRFFIPPLSSAGKSRFEEGR